MNNHEFNKQDELTRRQIMINSARAYLGVSVAPLLGGTLATGAIGATRKASGPGKLAEHVIFLNMTGGMSHIDTFDPKPKNKEVAGPVESIDRKSTRLNSSHKPISYAVFRLKKKTKQQTTTTSTTTHQ